MIELHKRDSASIKSQLNVAVYADSAALRAMAAVENVHLVVITTNTGPNVRGLHRGKPFDAVSVYPPCTETALVRQRSWAHHVVPVILRRAAGSSMRTDPVYRVILHNGEKPGSALGHFDGTFSSDGAEH